MKWTAETIDAAASMWEVGLTAAAIGKHFGVSRNAVLGLVHRRQDIFAARPKSNGKTSAAKKLSTRMFARPVTAPIRKVNAARAECVREARKTEVCANPCQAPWAEGHEVGLRSDLSRYRLSGLPPVRFAALGNSQCRFPLVCFDAASGPDMPCCGANTEPLKSYCHAHIALMAGRAA